MNTKQQGLVRLAQSRIKTTVDRFGLNSTYAAYSGGKDSEAVRRLTIDLYPRAMLIHNGHRGERVSPHTEGILFVKEPKAENVPLFLKTVNLRAQLDGTRRDEDKTVIFDGVEIHRSQMPSHSTDNGVFGLHVCYPLFDWTEEDVFAYLRFTNPIRITDVHYSYEGEGDLLGTKTLFCRYDRDANDEQFTPGTDGKLDVSLRGVGALYITATGLTKKLSLWATTHDIPTTIEVHQNNFTSSHLFAHPLLKYFIVCDKSDSLPLQANVWVKVRVLEEHQLLERIALANVFAQAGHTVLLMPEFSLKDWNIGEMMMNHFNDIHSRVRFMPPVQSLLGIK